MVIQNFPPHGVFQLHQELWLVSWERGSTDPGSSCQLAWWLEQGIHFIPFIQLNWFYTHKHIMYLRNVSVTGLWNRPLLSLDYHSYSESKSLWAKSQDQVCEISSFLSCSSLLMVGKLSMALLQKPQQSWWSEDPDVYPIVYFRSILSPFVIYC